MEGNYVNYPLTRKLMETQDITETVDNLRKIIGVGRE